MSTPAKARQVGVDLQDSEETRALVEAIEADNPGVTLRRMPGLVKLQTPGELVIRRESVEKKLYAVIDGFAQGQGHLSLTDARYVNSLKLFLQGVTPLEYAAHRHFAFLARHLDGPGARFAALCQSIDELRHTQTEVHTLSQYNKYYGGLHDWSKNHDRLWYLSVPKSFVEDGMSAGPFEFLTAISFSFEYLLTNLLFVPFMSGASFNGDLATMTFGFSAQSDESRHMTLGLESVKFILEQDEGNVPIVQDWIDKWFWRAYRLLGLVAAMMDYMLPKKVMSWK